MKPHSLMFTGIILSSSIAGSSYAQGLNPPPKQEAAMESIITFPFSGAKINFDLVNTISQQTYEDACFALRNKASVYEFQAGELKLLNRSDLNKEIPDVELQAIKNRAEEELTRSPSMAFRKGAVLRSDDAELSLSKDTIVLSRTHLDIIKGPATPYLVHEWLHIQVDEFDLLKALGFEIPKRDGKEFTSLIELESYINDLENKLKLIEEDAPEYQDMFWRASYLQMVLILATTLEQMDVHATLAVKKMSTDGARDSVIPAILLGRFYQAIGQALASEPSEDAIAGLSKEAQGDIKAIQALRPLADKLNSRVFDFAEKNLSAKLYSRWKTLPFVIELKKRLQENTL